jgi:hypothetical protein
MLRLSESGLLPEGIGCYFSNMFHNTVRTSTQNHQGARGTRSRPVTASLYAGLGLTVLSVAAVHVDRTTTHLLAAHLERGYPAYSSAQIDEAVGLWAIVLSTVGALGIVGWLVAIWATRSGRRWASWLVTGLFAVGTSLALYLLFVRDTSGDTGLPALLGGVGVLPSVAGLAAVVLLWRRPQRPVGAPA